MCPQLPFTVLETHVWNLKSLCLSWRLTFKVILHKLFGAICVWQTQIDWCVRAAALWLSVDWVMESHGYLSAGWRRKHNPEEEGCCYQSVHVGQRARSGWTRSLSALISLTPILFVSLSVLSPSVCDLSALWPAPRLSSRQSSELLYNVCGGFSAVSTPRYDKTPDFFLWFLTCCHVFQSEFVRMSICAACWIFLFISVFLSCC